MATLSCPSNGAQLAAFLHESYHGPRAKCPRSDSGPFAIKVDDQVASDVGAYFCTLTVNIQDSQSSRFTLHMTNPPLDDDTGALISDKGGTITGPDTELQVEIPLLITDVGYLRKLAHAVRRIVGRGRTYPNRNWKWVCRRTADSLDRLADRLMEYRRLRRHTPARLAIASSMAVTRCSVGSGSAKKGSTGAATVASAQTDEEDLFRLLGAE